MEQMFGKTFRLLATMLDYRAERSKLISSNIANLESPDYEAADYVFTNELRQSMDAKVNLSVTNAKHFPSKQNNVSKDKFQVVKSGEKANLDKEMTKLAENQLMYNLNVELLARKFRSINNVLKEAK